MDSFFNKKCSRNPGFFSQGRCSSFVFLAFLSYFRTRNTSCLNLCVPKKSQIGLYLFVIFIHYFHILGAYESSTSGLLASGFGAFARCLLGIFFFFKPFIAKSLVANCSQVPPLLQLLLFNSCDKWSRPKRSSSPAVSTVFSMIGRKFVSFLAVSAGSMYRRVVFFWNVRFKGLDWGELDLGWKMSFFRAKNNCRLFFPIFSNFWRLPWISFQTTHCISYSTRIFARRSFFS